MGRNRPREESIVTNKLSDYPLQIPDEIILMACKIANYFSEQNIEKWQLSGIESRDFYKTKSEQLKGDAINREGMGDVEIPPSTSPASDKEMIQDEKETLEHLDSISIERMEKAIEACQDWDTAGLVNEGLVTDMAIAYLASKKSDPPPKIEDDVRDMVEITAANIKESFDSYEFYFQSPTEESGTYKIVDALTPPWEKTIKEGQEEMTRLIDYVMGNLISAGLISAATKGEKL